MTDAESAWLAGILEGEGCFDWNVVRSSKRYPRIRIEMRDKDVIERVKSLIGGGGAVRERPTSSSRHNTTWLYQVADKATVERVLLDILPWMSERRTAKIQELLAAL